MWQMYRPDSSARHGRRFRCLDRGDIDIEVLEVRDVELAPILLYVRQLCGCIRLKIVTLGRDDLSTNRECPVKQT